MLEEQLVHLLNSVQVKHSGLQLSHIWRRGFG